MKFDSTQTEIANVAPGDFFVAPGSPGHAVVVLDVATNGNGKRVMMLGQGFMPAQEFHVIKSPNALDSVWFPVPDASGSVTTPSWAPFSTKDLRRFK